MNLTWLRKPYSSLHSEGDDQMFNPDLKVECLYLKATSDIITDIVGMFDSSITSISGVLCRNFGGQSL
jgi:hypothetical protein